MRDGFVVIRTFGNEVDAQIAQGTLASLGVSALLETDNCGGMRPHLDLTVGVRLLVAQPDADRALEILAAIPAPAAGVPWACPGCGEEVEGNFDTCWNCGRARG